MIIRILISICSIEHGIACKRQLLKLLHLSDLENGGILTGKRTIPFRQSKDNQNIYFAYFVKMLDCSVQVLNGEMRRLFFVRHGELLSNALFHVERSQQSIIGRYSHLVRHRFDVSTLFFIELGILVARCILGRCICGDLHCKNRRVQRCKS